MLTVDYGQALKQKICLALGFFDGVHIGHRKIIQKVKEIAATENSGVAVSTFTDNPNKKETLLGYGARKHLFEEMGVEYCISLNFGRIHGMNGADFFDELISRYNISQLVCGEDYRFGADNRGVDTLAVLCKQKGIGLAVVKLIDLDGVRVSSTAIKLFLKSGNLKAANRMLDCPYHVTGRIVAGNGIGRRIGMPTVNINRPDGIVPLKEGVYATVVEMDDGTRFSAVTNYGDRPTFGISGKVIESHLIGYEGQSLCGRDITVYFIEFLRLIRKFGSGDALVEQIKKDIIRTKDVTNWTKR